VSFFSRLPFFNKASSAVVLLFLELLMSEPLDQRKGRRAGAPRKDGAVTHCPSPRYLSYDFSSFSKAPRTRQKSLVGFAARFLAFFSFFL